uniref:Putative DNA topoisomerase-primase n=1 Tax=viral metagenome TaxID=1070528 RepID=A0A6M3J641_9ZZZZ
MTNKKPSLIEFYQTRFNSDPYALLDFFSAEVSDAAAEVKVDWQKIASDIVLDDKKMRGKIPVTEKSYTGKVAVYGSIKTTRSGIAYPHIAFHTAKDGGHASSFNGYAELLELYKREQGVEVDAETVSTRKREQDEKRKARETRQAAKAEKDQKDRARRHAEHCAYQESFCTGATKQLYRNTVEHLGDEDGSAPYFVRKRISDIVSAGVIHLVRMRDRDGEFTAIELHNVHGDYLGLQRLYDNFKKYTVAVDDHQFDGAHCVIGNLELAEQAYITEGFATSASVWLATEGKLPVIVAMNADNLKKVIADYRKHHPELRLINAADNDAFKPHAGNKGLITALELNKTTGVRAVYPIFDDLDCSGQPTDFNDLHCLAGLEEVARQIKAKTNRLAASSHYFDYCLQRLKFAGTNTATEEALKAASAGMLLCPIVHSTQDIGMLIDMAVPKTVQYNRFKVQSRILWLAKGKLSRAKGLRSFTPQALNSPDVNYIQLAGEVAEHGNVTLPTSVLDMVESLQGCIIVRSPMGSGKTENLIRPVMQNAVKAAYLAHRISLIGDASNRLQIANYQDTMSSEIPYISHMACCVNSIINPKFSNADGLNWFATVDTLCIDEASQVVRHTANGPVDNPVRVMDGLVSAIRASNRILLCDADANDSLIDFCRMARPGEPIHVIEVTGNCNHISALHTDIDSAFGEVIRLAHDGQRVLVANDSAKDGKKMAEVLRQTVKDAKVLHVHKDSKADSDVEAFLASPNTECAKYDVIIYSPAISSGVSITSAHFDHHVSIFHGVVPPTDAVQMMRRDRTARRYVIGIGINTTQRETDREAIYRGLVAADEFTVDFEETDEEIILRRQKTIFDEVRLASIAEENKARNDFANNLLLILIAEGYQVSKLSTCDEEVAVARKLKKWGKQIVEQKRFELVMAQVTPDEETFQRLSRSELRSEAESAQIDRYQIETQLLVEDIDPEIIAFYDDMGLKKVAALELLQSTEAEAAAYDRVQIKNKVVITKHNYKKVARHLYRAIFSTLGVNPDTGEGEFTHNECRAAMAETLKDKAAIELYNALRIGPHANPHSLPKDATTWIKGVMARFGLTICKRKTGGKNRLYINSSNWDYMASIVNRRRENGISSLQIHDQAAPAPLRPAAGLNAPAIPAEAFGGEACAGRDSLQSEVINTDGKYPHVKDRVIRIVSKFISDTEIPTEFAIAQLSRQDFEDIDGGRISRGELVDLLRQRYHERKARLIVNARH